MSSLRRSALGLDDLGLQRVATQRGRDERLQRRHDRVAQPLAPSRRSGRRDDQRADLVAIGVSERDRAAPLVAIGRASSIAADGSAERLGDARGPPRQRRPSSWLRRAAAAPARRPGRPRRRRSASRARARELRDRAHDDRDDDERRRAPPSCGCRRS